ncbi:phosphotransferase enzyme family protein [Rhizobium sp. PAMB 3174]
MQVIEQGGANQVPGSGIAPPVARMSDKAYFETASRLLAERPASLEPGMPAKLLARQYGLDGNISNLSSEVECTDEVTLSDGRRLILKTSTRPESVDSFRFQASALSGLKGATGFVVPEIVCSSLGTLTFNENGVCGYLQTRIEGLPLHALNMGPDLLRRAGASLAALDAALGRLDMPAIDRPILWHIGCWPGLMGLQQYLPPGQIADNVHEAMETYMAYVAPRLNDLEWQVTHNDPSPFNMLLTDGGIAFIDFGDGCWSPRIQDLAIAASHMVTDPAFPLGGAEYLISGYASQFPLSSLEARLLVGLMRARQSALILINNWRARLFPAEAGYILKNVARAERGLTILRQLSSVDEEAAISKAVTMT